MNLAHGMLCEITGSDKKEKEVYNISGNCLINPKILTINIGKVLVCCKCEQEKAIQMKIED